MTHPAEGPETPETMDAAERLRRDNLAHAEAVVLTQPPASWMPCAAPLEEVQPDA